MAWDNSNTRPVEPINSPVGANAWDTANPPPTMPAPPPVVDTYTQCPPGQRKNQNGQCVPDQYAEEDPSQCPPGQRTNQNGQCVPDQYAQDEECPPGQVWDFGLNTCKPSTGDGSTGGECPPGQVKNQIGQCVPDVQCPEGQRPNLNGQCVPDQYAQSEECPPGQVWDFELLNCRMQDVDFDPAPNPTLPAPPTVDPYDVSQSPDWMNSPTSTGGVSSVNPQAGAFDYGGVSDFSDAAWQDSMRYIEPQMDLQNDRFAQELINKGIDPNSEAGQKAFRQKSMGQNDMMSKAAFDSLGFGAGIQNQMFGQDATRSQLSNALLQSQMGLTQRGQEFDTQAGMSANDQAFNQMMGLEGLGYRDYLTGVDQSRYQDTLALALMGMAPGPSYNTTNTGLSNGPGYEYQNQSNYFNNLYSG
jgi:hypothetical protein